jgi:hypothetical protein
VIAGAGLAIGYWNRGDLTAQQFVTDRTGLRWYRTGDRGRWCEDGQLEHLGRLDRQLKLRGFRIEPAEIEAVLRRHPAVDDAVVVAHAATGGDPRLVAYFVPKGDLTPTGTVLRAHGRQQLPPHMVPGVFVPIAQIPRLASGKLDLRALPNPFAGSLAEPRGPTAARTPTEALIADIWKELLGLGQIDIHATFLEVGGHSLLALQAAARLESALGRKVRLRTFFTHTLAQMAAVIDDADGARRAGLS